MSLGHYLSAALHARVSRGRTVPEAVTVPVDRPEEREGDDLPFRHRDARHHSNRMARPDTVRGYDTK